MLSATMQPVVIRNAAPSVALHDQASTVLTINSALTDEQLVANGGYDWVCEDYFRTRFQRQMISGGLPVFLVHLRRWATTQQALASLDILGLRPLCYDELLVLACKQPNLQRSRIIPALGSLGDHRDGQMVACLWAHLNRYGHTGLERILTVRGTDRMRWDPQTCFPASSL
jgi:hypothetical protein